jgi:transglutaminase-like putative cysteine protease
MPADNPLLAAPPEKPASSAVTFNIAAAPAWVKKIEPASKGSDGDSGGISYLLFDRQENVALQSAYFHEARQVTSENGVQNGAAVSVSFDPAYQELIFHSLQVTRGGMRANRLDRSQIKLFQREKDMESFLYDGAYTAQCELEDIRAGDIIEFAYTIKGTNPVLGARYTRVFYTDWSFRVHRVVTRFLYPAQRKLRFLTKNVPLKPMINSTGATTEWLSDQANVAARRIDADVPADHDPNGWLQVSEYESWQTVADWALPLFRPETAISADLQAEVAKLRQIPDAEKRVLAALKLVQEQLRYLGIEAGVGSHRPTSPSEVFRRRFGDCKDKALLLATLLQQSGVDAVPALVSTDFRGTVAERLPAPNDFDHAIVHVKIGDQVHWLDPTRSSQRGPLSQIYVRDLKQALVLRVGTQGLTSYSPPRDSLPWKTVTENYRVPAPGGTGELEVVTESHGLSAERTRSAFQESGREKIEKQYLQYYARLFPLVTVKKSLVYEEIPEANACRTREFYSIPEIWKMNEEEKRYDLELHPGDVAEAMGSAGPSQRDDPLALNYPARITQVIHAKMFDKWSITAKNQSINNAFYRFSEEAKVDGDNVTLTYAYEALADRVAPRDLPAYNAGLSKIRDKLGYTLFYQKPGESLDFDKMVRQFNWRVALLTVGVALVVSVLCGLYFFKSKLPVPLPPPPATLLGKQGLGGWLILVGIHHVARPFVFIAMFVLLFPTVFNLEVWRGFTEPAGAQFHPYWKPVLLFELFSSVVLLIVSGLLLLLFFRKRAVWPRTYAAFLLFVLAYMMLDFWFVQKIPTAGTSPDGNIRDLVQVIIAAAIWVPYCFVSKRVKATFRR